MTVVAALGFIDQTLYANEDNPKPSRWRNDEVLELLRDIRAHLVADTMMPLFEQEWAHLKETTRD
jgi:hypothetical protein